MLNVVSTLSILDINPLSDVLVCMFHHSVGCLFVLLMIPFAVQNFFTSMYSQVFIFAFLSLVWGDTSNKKFVRTVFKILLPMFFSRIFMVWGLNI